MYEIKSNIDAYHPLIAQFVASEFPRPTTKHSSLLMELLSNEIIGTKTTRLGPMPTPESQVAIRSVISHWLHIGEPIPFSVPWGSKKPDGSIIDIAELSAMKVLQGLQNRIQQHYTPGAVFVIRSEDVAASWLYFDRPTAAEEAKRYSDGLELLPQVLGLHFIRVMRESTKTTPEAFYAVAASILPAMEDYLLWGDSKLDALMDLGWSGPINAETVAYYLHLYEKLYPAKSRRDRLLVLARYFSGALARRKLGLRGNDPTWGKQFIDLAFMAAIPGTQGYFGPRVHYRTLPTPISSNHMIPWRSKGVLKIGSNNSVTPNLCGFDDPLEEVSSNTITLSNANQSVDVKADYKLV